MNIFEKLEQSFCLFIQTKYPNILFSGNPHFFSINADESKKEFGDINSNIALVIAKTEKQNPKKIAQDVMNGFIHEFIEKIEIAGVGFLNFFIKRDAFKEILKEINQKKSEFFKDEHLQIKKINIEFVSANPTGPLHFGHGRGGIIGDTLARIFTFLGHHVTKEFYINDAGNQMQKLGASFKARCLEQLGINAAIPEDGYFGEYLIDLAIEFVKTYKDVEKKSDSFFVEYAAQKMLADIQHTLLKYGINFDVWFSEKTLHENGDIEKVINELKERKLVVLRDDAWWFLSTQFDDDKDRVVKKGSGELTYIAADIAYLKNKIERNFDHLIMILGHDHHGYVARLHAVCKAFSYDTKNLDIILYQLVKITKEGALVRMSKRAGNIVTLDEVIDTVSSDVARFFYLQKKADSPLEFDIELALKKSDENPVFYIQYAYVRCCSILKKASSFVKTLEDKSENNNLMKINEHDLEELSFDEIMLVKKICILKQIFHDIIKHKQPHLLAQITIEIATYLHQYYAKNTIVDTEKIKQSRHRIFIIKNIKEILEMLFDLLGISKPEKM